MVHSIRRQQWFACVVAVLGVIPGAVLGGLALMMMQGTARGFLGDKPDVLFIRAITGWELPGDVMRWIFFEATPNFVHGAVSGWAAMWIVKHVARASRYDIPAYTAAGVYTGICLLILIFGLAVMGFTTDAIVVVIQMVGLWVGLVGTSMELPPYVEPSTSSAPVRS